MMGADVMEQGISDAMNSVRQKYLRKLVVQREDIARLSRCDGGGIGEAAIADLRGVAHKLAGTGKIYGFPEISEAGYALECALREGTAEPADIDRRTRYLLSVMERAIRSVDAGGGQGKAPARRAAVATKPAVAKTPAQAASAQTAATLGKPSLLVIDDDEGITDLVQSLFDGIAHVTACADVTSGLLAAYETRPHLILLDEEMPGERTGLDLLQQLRDMPITANVPIIMMSANDSLTAIM